MAKKVRSELFHGAGGMKDEFRQHIALIWQMKPSQHKILLKHLPRLLSAVTERELLIAREDYVRDVGGDAESAIKAAQVLQAIAGWWSPVRDTAEVALQDIQILKVLPEDPIQREKALTFLKRFFHLLEKDGDRKLRRATAGAILKNLRSVDTQIDNRAIVDSEFDWRTDDPREYRPSVRGFVPVAIIQIVLGDAKDSIVFQAERVDVEMLVRQFQATLKDMDASAKFSR